MRLKGRQLRFLVSALGMWILARGGMLLTGEEGGPRAATAVATAPDDLLRMPEAPVSTPFHVAASPVGRLQRLASLAAVRVAGMASFPPAAAGPASSAGAARAAPAGSRDARAPAGLGPGALGLLSAGSTETPLGVPPPAAVGRRPSRWAASAYLFVRPGSGPASIAAGGELGGSQAAARLTYRLNPGNAVRTAVAARVYAPLADKGAEAALGLDWYPLAGVPLRLSIERRVGLDAFGRDAWSAYAAGGFYAEPLGADYALDGYGQAGVVGVHARDLFVDGAVRAGRRLRLGRATATVGAGLWGAAQPRVARVDAGPRLAVTVPVAQHALTAAVEGRLRIAGDVRPGSGAAFTMGVDF